MCVVKSWVVMVVGSCRGNANAAFGNMIGISSIIMSCLKIRKGVKNTHEVCIITLVKTVYRTVSLWLFRAKCMGSSGKSYGMVDAVDCCTNTSVFTLDKKIYIQVIYS